MGRILRTIFTAEAIGWILVLLALQMLIFGITSSLRGTTDTASFFWVCLPATLMALALSKRSANGMRTALGMVIIGTLGIGLLGARLFSPLFDLADAAVLLLPQLIPAFRSHIPIDTTAVTEAWQVVAEASATLGARVQLWLAGLDRNTTVNDPLIRNLAWLMILWLLSAWMGWFTGRRNAIAALLPAILLLGFVTSYSERRIESLWLMVFILPLLMGVWNYKNHTVQWESKRVDYADSIRYDVSQAVVFLTILIGIVAFITPSVSWRQVREYLRQRDQQNEIAEILGVQQQPVAVKPALGPKPSLPREHLLTGGFAQSEKIVMTIRTGELPPISSPVLTVSAPRYYWRSVTYDSYVGAGWVTTYAAPQRVEPNTPLITGIPEGYKTLHLDVEMMQPEGKLFWSGILFSTDIPIRADWRVAPQPNLFADQTELLRADMFAAVSKASKYRAQSYVPLVTTAELRSAPLEYSDEIRERYLQLPSSVPRRVRQLAREITKDQTTAYDKAKAIEGYLRTTYSYDLDVPVPPEDRDVADYFLFDLKKGYCDYYATAMVVLARASGLPARFVSGYAAGSYDFASAQYIVRELNAHSWPEVYFPTIGWIEFEPTAAQPVIERLERQAVIPAEEADSVATRLLYRFRLETMLYWSSPFALMLFGFVLYFTVIERWLYLRLAPAAAVEKIYKRLYRLGRPLAGERTKAETAQEFMDKLVQHVMIAKERSRFKRSSSAAGRDIQQLTGLYQDSLFSLNNIQKEDARKALRVWKRLRVRLILARLRVMVSSLALSRGRQRHYVANHSRSAHTL
jgi:transglutaminase-like putative cysteine protease